MYKLSIGDKVHTKPDDTGMFVNGRVVGFGWLERNGTNSPVVMVELDEGKGAYINNDQANTYVAIISVLPEYLEKE